MLEPLKIAFTVDCSPEHAFDTWTDRATAWWPPEHTVSHEPGARIVFEGRPGGRIYERTTDGREIEWGRIVEWRRPQRLRYLWHIATDASHATDVEIVFRAVAARKTRIEIEHGGWDRLAEAGAAWRDANHSGWDGTLPAFREACARPG